MKSFFKLHLAWISLIFLIGNGEAFGNSYRNYIIPNATITIDGNKSDWNGISPAFEDEVNDQNPLADFDGTDLDKFYISKDNNFLYFMMELFDGDPKTDIGTQYLFGANAIFADGGSAGDRFVSCKSHAANSRVLVAERTDGNSLLSVANYSEEYLAIGSKFLEWKLDFEDMGNLNKKFIQTWIHVDGENVSDYDRTNIQIIDSGGRISGSIADYKSQTIDGAIVQASAKCGDLFFESLPTDNQGNYKITLEPGSYYLSYEVPETGVRFWYSNGASTPICSQATPITVTNDNETANINFQLPPMLLEFWYIQNRSYENGNSLNKVSFAMKDMEGNYILDDVLTSIELFDPDGTQIQPNEDGFGGSYQTVYGQYQPYDGWWSFGDTLRDESWYYINFDEPLKEGDYHLVVTDQSGNQYEAYATFNGVQSLPAISSETICAFQDSEGNIQWKWEIPPDKFSNVSTSIRTWLTGYSAGGNYLGEIYSRVPTHMGWSFAPANLIQQLEQAGAETFQIGIHVRTNDNNNRFYTSQVPWDEANGCGCDVDGNQKTGLVEAIHSLQVVAGIR